MDDSELNAIRAARLAELQKNAGQGPASSSSQGAGRGADSGANANGNDAMKQSMLSQILSPSARERLSRVRIVRPDRAEAVENYLIKLVSMGSIARKLNEDDIVEILDGISRDDKSRTQGKIVFNRKQDDSDDDFFD